MSRWKQVLLEEKARNPAPARAPEVRRPEAEREKQAAPGGEVLLVGARAMLLRLADKCGFPRVRLQPGVYVCEGEEMWRRFVPAARPRWIEVALHELHAHESHQPEGLHDPTGDAPRRQRSLAVADALASRDQESGASSRR